jgi:glucose-6-phosphate isomerase
MSSEALWGRFKNYFQFYSELGFGIDISRMRFGDDFFSSLQAKTSQAFASMQELEAGAIANLDEKRMVGHYWLRTPSLSPTEEIKKEIQQSTVRVSSFAKAIHDGTIKSERGELFKNVLVIGIGGSALGPQLIAEALGSSKDKMSVCFIDNTDPDGIKRILSGLGEALSKTLVLVISKSGGTAETRNGAVETAAVYQQMGLDFAKHAVAITCDGSKLFQQAKSESWLEIFPMYDWVGGRTSLFSTVGLVPMALQGVEIGEFIAGGSKMDQITRQNSEFKNPAMLLAAMWYFAGDGLGKKDMVILPYKDRLVLFSKYLQQLVMESIGKEKDLSGKVVNQGIAVYGNKGSTDQHAYIQQLREGLNNFFATFIEVQKDFVPWVDQSEPVEIEPGITAGDYLEGFYLGTRRALYENNRDSITITVSELNAQTLGALIALYDRAVGFYASLVNVNAYHQPGVEAGKVAANNVIKLQKEVLSLLTENKGMPYAPAEIAATLNLKSETETIFKLLFRHAVNNSKGVQMSSATDPLEAKFSCK